MRFKKFLGIAAAAVMTASVLSLAACGNNFTPPVGDYTSETAAVSNGGFVVEYGKYVYFVNGIETTAANNTFGAPVKGALQRILKSDLLAGKNQPQTVVPSLMVASDYTSGVYIYDGRVYYATPNNVKNSSGQTESDYLDFKSAKLDGTDVKDYLKVADNTTVYRYVQTEKEGPVYMIYVDGSTLHSYNTATKKDVVLAEDVVEYKLNRTDVTDPNIYYTMEVKDDIDVIGGSTSRKYNQIYTVRADATEAPYTYTWNQDYLDANDGKEPYVNLGKLVFDGIGSLYTDLQSPFTHDLKEGVTPIPPVGYTYTLQSYENGGIYFKRQDLTASNAGSLYYVSAEQTNAAEWNSINGNASLDVIARPGDTSNASSSALYYLKEGKHGYLYVKGTNIIRAEVEADGSVTEQEIAREASGATLLYLDSDGVYDYVWYTVSGSIERAVYNGTEHNYDVIQFEDENNKPYRPVRILDVQHASGWYNFEVIDGVVFFADAESYDSTAYNYVSAINLTKDGKMLDNEQIEEGINAKYDELKDASDGYFAKTTKKNDNDATVSIAMQYYFYTGKTEQFYANIEEAKEVDEKKAIYEEEEIEAFEAFANPQTDEDKAMFTDENGVSYRVRSYFITRLGTMTEEDEEALNDYWQNRLERNAPAEEESEGLADWEIALIVVGCVLVAAGAVLGGVFGARAQNKKQEQARSGRVRLAVDTTDDRSVDVYADDTNEPQEEIVPEEAVEELVPEEPQPEDKDE